MGCHGKNGLNPSYFSAKYAEKGIVKHQWELMGWFVVHIMCTSHYNITFSLPIYNLLLRIRNKSFSYIMNLILHC